MGPLDLVGAAYDVALVKSFVSAPGFFYTYMGGQRGGTGFGSLGLVLTGYRHRRGDSEPIAPVGPTPYSLGSQIAYVWISPMIKSSYSK